MTIIKQFDGRFESLASAATNRNVVLEWLTAATTTQYSKITKLLGTIASNSTNTNSAALAAATRTPQNTITRTPALPRKEKDKLNWCITQLNVMVQVKWVSGVVYSTHVYGVSDGHTSGT